VRFYNHKQLTALGALYFGASSVYNLSYSTLTSNQAVNGGAIAIFSSSGVIYNSSFTSNEASNQGGAVYLAPGVTGVHIIV